MSLPTIEVPEALGDAIYCSFYVREYIVRNGPVDILLPKPLWCGDIWRYLPGVASIRVKAPGEVATETIDLQRAFRLCVRRYNGDRPFWHTISEDMGLSTDHMLVPPLLLPLGAAPRQYQQRVLLSPYSTSCTSREGKPANKMLGPEHWQGVFDLLLWMWRLGWIGKPLFIGGPGEQLLTDVLPEYELLGADFDTVVSVVRSAQCIIGVDTGTIRLANMLGVQAFFTTPLGLGKMFIPNWGGFTQHETGHPGTYSPEQFRDAVDRFIRSRL